MTAPVRNYGSDNLVGLFLALVLLGPLLFVIVAALVAWPVMLFIGNASIASGGLIPALGYQTTFWLTAAVLLLTSSGHAKSS